MVRALLSPSPTQPLHRHALQADGAPAAKANTSSNNEVAGPRVTIGEDGRIVVDASSLTVAAQRTEVGWSLAVSVARAG